MLGATGLPVPMDRLVPNHAMASQRQPTSSLILHWQASGTHVFATKGMGASKLNTYGLPPNPAPGHLASNNYRRIPSPVERSTVLCFVAPASALAVALMMASEVIVAPLVASTPLTLCLAMILRGTSVKAE